MGCIFSRGELHDLHPYIFKVDNVDDEGNCVRSGRIEVTPSELILYQKNKDPIYWPLRSLRRYGWDAELFSFESGRRAPTGPGIYAFKCLRAQELFNILQARFAAEEALTQRLADNLAPPLLSRASNEGYLQPVPPRIVPRIRTTSTSPSGGARVRLDSVDSCSETHSPSPSTSTPPTVIEAHTTEHTASREVASGFKEGNSSESPSDVERNNNGHEYSNGVVTSSGFGLLDAMPLSLGANTFEETDNHIYVNVSSDIEPQIFVLNKSLVPYFKPETTLVMPDEPIHGYANYRVHNAEVVHLPSMFDTGVNYAVLDLQKPTCSSPGLTPTGDVPPESPKEMKPPRTGYATIDFEKTTALTHSATDREATRQKKQNAACR